MEPSKKPSRRGRKPSTNPARGTSWNAKNRKWVASIMIDGTSHYLGLFAERADAVAAYDAAVDGLPNLPARPKRAPHRTLVGPARGATWCKDVRKWKARISMNGVVKTLGHFNNVEDAVAAYDAAAIERDNIVKTERFKVRDLLEGLGYPRRSRKHAHVVNVVGDELIVTTYAAGT